MASIQEHTKLPAHSPNERGWFIFCATKGWSCRCGSWLCKILYFTTWAFIKVASLARFSAAKFQVLHIPEEKEGGVGKTLRISWFGFMFNSWYSLHLYKGQGLWGKFTNEECRTWSAAVAGRLANVNCSRWCILHPKLKKVFVQETKRVLFRRDHANWYKLASETVQPFSAYWWHSKWLLVFCFGSFCFYLALGSM